MKKLNIKILSNIICILPFLTQASATKPLPSTVLKNEGIEFQGNFKNWKLDLHIDQTDGTITKSKEGIWYKNNNYSIFAPFNSKFALKYFSKNGKKLVFSKDNVKPYFISSKPYFKGSSDKEMTYHYDNQTFLTSSENFGLQSVKLTNGIEIIRGIRREMSISMMLPNKDNVKSHPRNQLRFWPDGSFTLFKNGKPLIKI